ncbi:MAG: hypothetical protein V4692_03270 [Bdellovibrionota bacterium]
MKKSKTVEAPRAPRVVLLPFFPLHFVTTEDRDLSIANISTSGIGFHRDSFSNLPEKGQGLSGLLQVQDKSYRLQLEIVHVSSQIIGCVIEPQNPEFSKDLNLHLDVELSAVITRPIDQKFLKENSEGTSHWYVGRENSCELFFIEKDGVLSSFHCTIWGHYFESLKASHLRIGLVSKVEKKSGSINHQPQSSLIDDLTNPSAELKQMAIRFVTNISQLESRFKSQILERL